MNEIWRDIEYDGYQVSNLGRVRSTHDKRKFGHIRKPRLTKLGYLDMSFHKRKTISIHRLVAKAFIDNPENKPCVNHINGIKTDNRSENLEWVTHKENNIHAYKTGLKLGQNENQRNAMTINFSKCDNGAIKVIDTNTGTIYNSIKEAYYSYNLPNGYNNKKLSIGQFYRMVKNKCKNKTTIVRIQKEKTNDV